jgi:TolB protein
LAFAAGKDNAWHILTRALDSTTTLDLTSDLAFARRPVFSPDGTRLAFEASDGAGHTNVFIASADGSNRAQITQASSYDGQATWSPSNPGLPLYSGEAARAGTDLAIAVEQNNQWDIYTIRADGSNLTRLTSDPAQDWQPAWSPRGDKIAFVSNRGGTFQIYTMAPDGSSVTRLTDFPVGAEQPAWSPDGRWLAFVAYTGDGQASQRREICLMMADGRGLVRLTQNAWEDTEPTWGQ